jgi:NAD(P)-dependent dehydrogenase (short-subunit alcohol dehydrogenase family)
MKPESEQLIAVVTGGSQGVGRGIALSLGSAGAKVYLTGRNESALNTTAAEIDARGGHGIAVRCDHAHDSQTEEFFSSVASDSGRIDVLVNNVWGGYEGHPHGIGMEPFWKVSDDWDSMFHRGLRAHLIATRLAIPLMLPFRRGLIINTIAWAQGKYLLSLYYDLAKHSIARMTYGMALELRPHGIAAVALAPGFVRTERVMAAHAAHPFNLAGTESPEYAGRAVVHLARDPDILRRSGQVLTAGALAREYGFTDVDGSQPETFSMPASMARD